MEYIDKLNQLRYEKCLSFYELGLRCDLSESAVKKILYKKCDPRISSIEKICRALDITLHDLFCVNKKISFETAEGDDFFLAICAPLPSETKNSVLQFLKETFKQ